MAQIDMKQAAGFLIMGAVAGAAIALVYAPQSGVQTRNNIRKFARSGVDRLEGLQEDIRGRVTDWVDGVTEVVQDGIDRGKTLGAEGYDQVLKGFDDAKKCVEDGRSRIEQLIKTV